MVKIFQIAAVVLAGAAAYFWWAGNADFMFAGIVLAICSFFLSMRFQVKARNDEVAARRTADAPAEEDVE